ncbi:MAG TPA: hypothetical protein VMR70_19690 [Flavisolibacter sp.]|nr:hypothetical protein [Flavisolibacter sp.]
MRFAYPMQKLQDWLTQQWVILWGRKIKPEEYAWLMGPFGNLDAIGENFIHELAEKENLAVDMDAKTTGLIPSINSLNLSEAERSKLSLQVIDFYENTVNYKLHFSVKWNPFFRVFGVLINRLFSTRLNQLNIPVKNATTPQELTSELISLTETGSDQPKYTFWLRSIKSSGQAIYSGAYGIGVLPSGQACIKAVFPLPNGNATVLMTPCVGQNGELILESSGKRFGDAGFYFLLKDAKGEYWSQNIQSFRDRLTIRSEDGCLWAEQVLTLWKKEVLRFQYKIEAK